MSYLRRMEWGAQTVDSLASAADHSDIFIARQRCKIHEVGIVISVVTNGASAVRFDLTHGATRGDGDAGVLAIPTATAVNSVVKDTTSTIFPFTMAAGDFITPQVTSAATSGSGHYYVVYEPIEEVTTNETNVSESA